MNKSDFINIGESVKNLKGVYKKTTYFKNYGTSIFLFIFITFLFFIFFSYYNVKNNIHKYQSDPSKYRCHPSIMPFASYIYPHPGMTNTQFNKSNIMYCMKLVLKDILGEILLPLEYIYQLIQNIQNLNIGSFNSLRGLFSEIRNAFSGIFNLFFTLMGNLIASINNIIIYLSSAFVKTVTIPISVSNVATTIIYCMRILAERLLTWIISILVVLGIFTLGIFYYVFVSIYIPTSFIPFVGEFLAPIVAFVCAFCCASVFLVVYIIISVIYGEVANALRIGLNATAAAAPPPPKLSAPKMH